MMKLHERSFWIESFLLLILLEDKLQSVIDFFLVVITLGLLGAKSLLLHESLITSSEHKPLLRSSQSAVH